MSQRILFVVKSLFPAGSAYQLHLLTGELALRGLDIHVAVMDQDCQGQLDFAPNVAIHVIGQQQERWVGKTERLRRLVQKLNPAVVHSWDFDSAVISQLATVGMSTQRVSTLLEIPHTRELWFRMTCQLMAKRTRLTVCHEQISQFLIDHDFVPRSSPITVIPNAISPVTVNRESARGQLLEALGIDNPDALVITTVAELSPRTRIKDLIWAAALLNCVEYDVHLLVFGTGPQEKRLRIYANRTRSQRYVHLMQHSHLIEQAMAGSQVYWHSHLVRPLPTELMMAMAGGLPTISVLGDGTDRLVLHQQTSFATNYGARDEFARWTKYIVEQVKPTSQLVSQARENVQARFPVAAMTRPFLDLYQ